MGSVKDATAMQQSERPKYEIRLAIALGPPS